MEDKTIAVLTGIGAITLIEIVLILKGHNGTLAMAGLSGIGGLVGYIFGFKREKQKIQSFNQKQLKEYVNNGRK